MDERLIQILEQIKDHLDRSQGNDLKDLWDNENQAKVEKPNGDEEMMENGQKPKGISIAKIEVEGKPDLMKGDPSDHQEMSEEELEELLRNLK